MGNRRRFRCVFVAALVLTGLAGCVVPDPPPPGPGITAHILPPLPGYAHAVATDINERGEAVGWSLGPQSSYAKAVLWRNGRAVDLRPGGPATSFGYFVNERSQVLLTEIVGLNVRTFLWDAGRATDLSGDAARSTPIDLNDNGQALIRRSTGAILSAADNDKVGLWSNGTFTPIVHPTGGRISTADVLKLRDDGSVVGSFTGRPFVWRDGVYTDLGDRGRVVDVNERGQVLGTVQAGSTVDAVIWENGGATMLGPRDGSTFMPFDLSDDGRVAGQLIVGEGHEAVVWERGELIRLGAGRSADLVNDRGIVGGVMPDATSSAFHAVVWVDRRMTDLGNVTYVHDLNNRGQMVGTMGDADGDGGNGIQGNAVLWTVAG